MRELKLKCDMCKKKTAVIKADVTNITTSQTVIMNLCTDCHKYLLLWDKRKTTNTKYL